MSKGDFRVASVELEQQEANEVWSMVMDTSLIKSHNVQLNKVQFNKILQDANLTNFSRVEPRQEVLITARFIANIDPSYRNSQGEPVPLSYLRSELNLTPDDIDYVIGRLEEVVKPFISVSTETVITGLKLKVETAMSKKRLIKAALNHLLNGSEVLDNPELYAMLKEAAVIASTPKISYAYLIGAAEKLRYDSVPAMMEDLVLTFIDQTENLARDGKLVFYDGSVRVEKM